MPQYQRTFSPLPSWSILEDRSREQSTCTPTSPRSMMDEFQSPSSNKKRNSVAMDSLPGARRRPTKKTKIVGDALSQSSSKTPSNNSPVTPSSRTGKNAKAGPSTKSSATSESHDAITPIRMSSRVSRPTLKKKAQLFERRSRSPESDGTPPSSIIPPAIPSLKRKKPLRSHINRFTGNNTPSKSKRIDPNPIELTSDDDDSRAQPPKKRVKRTHQNRLSFEVIDLCSENESVSSGPTRTRDKESVVVLSDEMDIEFLSFNHPAFGETDTRKSPSLPPLGDVSSPIQDEPVLQTLSSPRTHNTPFPKPKTPVAEEDSVTDENIHAEKVDLPRGSLQALYNEALARICRETQYAEDIVDQPSPFLSFKCTSPERIIHYSTQSQSPTLHTPLFFDRIILRLKARLKLKTSDAKAFSDTMSLGSTGVSTLAHFNNVMESSAVDSMAPDIATKTILTPPNDFQDGTSSGKQAAHISPCILVNNLDVNEGPGPKAPESPLENQASPSPPEVVVLEDTPIPESIQTQEVSANYKTLTSENANSSAISNPPSNLSNPDTVNSQIETPQEAETILLRREDCADQVAVIEPDVLKDAQFLVQALRRRYNALKISGPSLLPALESNDKATPNESLSEPLVISMEHATTTNASFPGISSSKNTSPASIYLSQSLMILTDHATILDVSLHTTSRTEDVLSTSEFSATPMIMQVTTLNPLTGSCSENASSSSECLSDSPAIATQHATAPNPSSLATSSNSADTLSPRNSSPSAHSPQASDSGASIESVNCHLVTPDDSPSPFPPSVKTQKQEPLIRSDPSSLPVVVSLFDMDLSNLNLRTLMGNSKFDEGGEDSDDDDISISGMELVYPEEII